MAPTLQMADRARWRWVLPVILVPLLAFFLLNQEYEYQLWVQDRVNAAEASGHDWFWEGPEMAGVTMPGELASRLIAGPGLAISKVFLPNAYVYTRDGLYFDFGALGGAAIQWGWIGWLIDTRERHVRPSRALRLLLTAGCLFLVGVLGLALWEGIVGLFSFGGLRNFARRIALYGLHDRALLQVALLAWCFAGFVYFAGYLIRMWRTLENSTQPISTVKADLLVWPVLLGSLGFVIGWLSRTFLFPQFISAVRAAIVGLVAGILVAKVLGHMRSKHHRIAG